jgi:ABC-type oligopeptide transport system substrate-binding subunit
MTDDVVAVNRQLTRLSRRLAVASNEYTKASRKAADSRSDYDVSKAKAMLKELKTAVDRQAEATLTCETEMRAARIDEALRDAVKERLKALEAVLNATQTKASFLKAEMQLAGKGY